MDQSDALSVGISLLKVANVALVTRIVIGTVVGAIWVEVTTSGGTSIGEVTVLVHMEAMLALGDASDLTPDVELATWHLHEVDETFGAALSRWVLQVTLGVDGFLGLVIRVVVMIVLHWILVIMAVIMLVIVLILVVLLFVITIFVLLIILFVFIFVAIEQIIKACEVAMIVDQVKRSVTCRNVAAWQKVRDVGRLLWLLFLSGLLLLSRGVNEEAVAILADNLAALRDGGLALVHWLMLIDDGVAWITVAMAVSNVGWSVDLSWLLWGSWLLLISVVHLAEVWSVLAHLLSVGVHAHFRSLLGQFWSVWSVAHLWSLNVLTHVLSVRFLSLLGH